MHYLYCEDNLDSRISLQPEYQRDASEVSLDNASKLVGGPFSVHGYRSYGDGGP